MSELRYLQVANLFILVMIMICGMIGYMAVVSFGNIWLEVFMLGFGAGIGSRMGQDLTGIDLSDSFRK